MHTTRITAGLYQLTYQGRTFQIEDLAQASDGDVQPGWVAYEMQGDVRVYLSDHGTKRQAVARTIAAVDAGY
jgi:hypothetical protein